MMNGILIHNTQHGRCGYASPKLVVKSLQLGPTGLNEGFIIPIWDSFDYRLKPHAM